jgi:hypothetical protein
MKTKIILLLLLFVVCMATVSKSFAVILSETNSGIYIGISGTRTNTPLQFNDRLVWRPFCNTGMVSLNYPDPNYGIKIKMFGPDGNEVTKTKLGESFGLNFDQVHSYKDVIHTGLMGYHSSHMGGIEAQGRYDERDGPLLSGPLLPAPKELFQIEKPGIYTLEIQMQMFRVIKSTNQWTRELIQFSPIKIRVEKP